MRKDEQQKWFILFAALLGLSNILLFGSSLKRTSSLPQIDIPKIGEYTSYNIEATHQGYRVNYRANDPLIMQETRTQAVPVGFGKREKLITTSRDYTINSELYTQSKGGLTEKELACLKAGIQGNQQGRLTGSTLSAAASPTVSSIPVMGWLVNGWVNAFSQRKGGQIGESIAKRLEDC
tara:strand:+ start:830 stop:1366 length:537 start_codon:yes stop_codon:yes gene_type:complete